MRQRWRGRMVAVVGSPRVFDYFRTVDEGLTRRKGGRKPPFFIGTLWKDRLMIDNATIRNWVEEHLSETGGFLVDVTVSDGADIRVLVDAPDGMPISRCVEISRLIEGRLDRDVQDFALQVSTPGLDQPLKLRPQYDKNVGRGVKVQLHDGRSVEGTLTEVGDAGIVVEHKEKRRIEGRKAKEWVTDRHELAWDSIATTKVKISFKQ